MQTQNFSVCGVDCNVCDSFETSCRACEFYSDCKFPVQHEHTGAYRCPIYNCIQSKGFETCGSCEELPCKIWEEFKIPGWTDEMHRQSIRDRVELLKRMNNNQK